MKVFLNGREKDNNKIISVGVTISKVSLFKLDRQDHFHYDFDYKDPQSPTKESLEKSEKSPQPINLEENSRFTFNPENNQFFDKKKNKAIKGKDIIDYIYQQHIDTYTSLRGKILRIKMNTSSLLVKVCEAVGKCLIEVIPFLTGRKIENKAYNLLLSPFSFAVDPTKIKDNVEEKTVDYENMLRKINPFTFSIITTLVLALYILHYFCIDFLGIIRFIKANGDDQVFSVTLVAFVVLFFNYVLPNILLFLLNSLIKMVRKLYSKRFEL